MQRPTSPARGWFPAALLALSAGATPAAAAVGDWAEGDNVRMRVLAAGGDTLGAAVELELAPGWKTYWRTPGDSGIPPVFNFSASTNLGPVEVRFPVPERYDDGFGISNIYRDTVVLPLAAAPLDASQPVTIAVAVELGVCEEVCIPVRLGAVVTAAPGPVDPEAEAIVAPAEAALPGPAAPGFGVGDLARAGGTENAPEFTFVATVPEPEGAQIFVEGPEDWFASVPVEEARDGDRLRLRVVFDRLGSRTAIADAALRFTLVSGGRAVEETLPLD